MDANIDLTENRDFRDRYTIVEEDTELEECELMEAFGNWYSKYYMGRFNTFIMPDQLICKYEDGEFSEYTLKDWISPFDKKLLTAVTMMERNRTFWEDERLPFIKFVCESPECVIDGENGSFFSFVSGKSVYAEKSAQMKILINSNMTVQMKNRSRTFIDTLAHTYYSTSSFPSNQTSWSTNSRIPITQTQYLIDYDLYEVIDDGDVARDEFFDFLTYDTERLNLDALNLVEKFLNFVKVQPSAIRFEWGGIFLIFSELDWDFEQYYRHDSEDHINQMEWEINFDSEFNSLEQDTNVVWVDDSGHRRDIRIHGSDYLNTVSWDGV